MVSNDSDKSPPDAHQKWQAGLIDEVQFWANWVEASGGQWREEHLSRLDPNAPLKQGTMPWLREPEGATVDILDVGAGPFTFLGKIWPGRTVRITAVDPLADEYDQILAKKKIEPPVRTITGDALTLHQQFGDNRFDLVFCRNAMDHCPDPLLGIRNCLKVVKPGKYVLLKHFINEAEGQHYGQLHQWNFDSENGKFIIWNSEARIDVAEQVRDLSDEVICEPKPDRWLLVALKKKQ